MKKVGIVLLGIVIAGIISLPGLIFANNYQREEAEYVKVGSADIELLPVEEHRTPMRFGANYRYTLQFVANGRCHSFTLGETSAYELCASDTGKAYAEEYTKEYYFLGFKRTYTKVKVYVPEAEAKLLANFINK